MRMPKLYVASVIAAAFVVACPTQNSAQDQAPVSNGQFALGITPGPDYSTTTTILLFIKIPIYPQIACWVETLEGQYLETIYVTSKGAKKNFLSAPSTGRPEALPVWYHQQSTTGSAVDVVSGATAASASEHRAKLASTLATGRYQVMLEVNRSYDYNSTYTKENSGVNGQPSVIYRAELAVGRDPTNATFIAVGTGSVDGSSGSITPGLNSITTALTILKEAEIRYGGE